MIGDTIAAISTPLGEGGIGIVRISGNDAIKIAEKIFRPAKKKNISDYNFKIIYGHVVEPEEGRVIDEALLGIMRAPNTYTREDVIEINCHGGMLPVRKVLELVLRCGARIAEPGEFSKRAFLSGRLDMAQAEAVIDVIRATTEDSLKIAVGQLGGGLSKTIESIQRELLDITALIEANIDFPEDEVEEYNLQEIRQKTQTISKKIDNLLKSAETGKIYREGVKTVIAGKPNVGKSSLLNILLKEKRAIVSDIPGTTRDVIEEVLNIRGIPLKIIDTAGIRQTEDIIEKMGVARSRESIEQADLILMVFDADEEIDADDLEIAQLIKGKKGIKVINKIDISSRGEVREQISKILKEWPEVEISATEGIGIEGLEQNVVKLITGGRVIPRDGSLISNVRHKNQLIKAREHLKEAQGAVEKGMALDLIAIDVRSAWEAVGEINGTAITENIIDKIFTEFCIGK